LDNQAHIKKILTVNNSIYDKLNLTISNFQLNTEGKEYNSCSFFLNKSRVISRQAKITPKKAGYFVAVWKRNNKGITTPFTVEDKFDLFVINIQNKEKKGQFVFSKEVLKKYGIIRLNGTEGKRGFRLYAPWDNPTSKQAVKTQEWQLNYFLALEEGANIDLFKAKQLYGV
jgi:hypothetical protein